MSADEAALIERINSVDRDAAFAELFAQYRVRVFTICQYLTRSRADAEVRVDPPAAANIDPAEVRQDRERLWKAMEELSLEHRTVLALFAVEGMGHKEIASILGVPEGTVWSRLHLARKRLAALLA
jgi:RNA polymerase sigma-70 factor (ECF subfamily)